MQTTKLQTASTANVTAVGNARVWTVFAGKSQI